MNLLMEVRVNVGLQFVICIENAVCGFTNCVKDIPAKVLCGERLECCLF